MPVGNVQGEAKLKKDGMVTYQNGFVSIGSDMVKLNDITIIKCDSYPGSANEAKYEVYTKTQTNAHGKPSFILTPEQSEQLKVILNSTNGEYQKPTPNILNS